MNWSELLAHVFAIDMKICPNCSGEFKVITVIIETGAIKPLPGNRAAAESRFKSARPLVDYRATWHTANRVHQGLYMKPAKLRHPDMLYIERVGYSCYQNPYPTPFEVSPVLGSQWAGLRQEQDGTLWLDSIRSDCRS